jgi:hypothetical protein
MIIVDGYFDWINKQLEYLLSGTTVTSLALFSTLLEIP